LGGVATPLSIALSTGLSVRYHPSQSTVVGPRRDVFGLILLNNKFVRVSYMSYFIGCAFFYFVFRGTKLSMV